MTRSDAARRLLIEAALRSIADQVVSLEKIAPGCGSELQGELRDLCTDLTGRIADACIDLLIEREERREEEAQADDHDEDSAIERMRESRNPLAVAE